MAKILTRRLTLTVDIASGERCLQPYRRSYHPSLKEITWSTSPEDLAILRFGYKLSREFARRMPCYEGEYIPGHPVFPNGSEAECKSDVKPVPIAAPRIRYTAEDDKALDDYLRKSGECPNDVLLASVSATYLSFCVRRSSGDCMAFCECNNYMSSFALTAHSDRHLRHETARKGRCR